MMNEINNDAKNNVELALIKLDMAVFKDILDDIPRIFELRSGVLELEYLSAEILGTLKIRDSI